jgi:hypothetical protein
METRAAGEEEVDRVGEVFPFGVGENIAEDGEAECDL